MAWLLDLISTLFGFGSASVQAPKALRHGLSTDYWSRAPLDHDWRAELDAHWEE